MASTLKAALAALLKDNLDPADRAHLKRWYDWADDPIWQKVESDALKVPLTSPTTICPNIIANALQARAIAESVQYGEDPILRKRQQQRAELLGLAEKADDLARYYRDAEQYSGIAMFFQRFLMPVQDLRELHEKESQLLRQHARRQPKPTTRVSRQAHGKKRAQSRKYVAFMHLMADHMRDLSRKPQYYAVALATNIAFPKADVTAEDARAACRPTTRAGRRYKTGALRR